MRDTSDEVRHMTVGYPDFWQHAHASWGDFYAIQREIHPDLLKIMGYAESLPLAKTVKTLCFMVSSSMSGLTILTLNGHGLDAMRIARSMFEGSVNAAYLVKEPSELDAYHAYAKVSSKRLLDYTSSFGGKTKGFSEEQAAEIDAQYRAVRHLFPGKPEKLPNGWCRLQLAQMFERVGVGSWYRGFYHLSSALVHMDCRGMHSHFGVGESENPIFLFPPTDIMIKQAHAAARVAVHLVLTAYGKCTDDPDTAALCSKVAARVLSAVEFDSPPTEESQVVERG